jgi:transcriptional regulator with XRE-family HTH domain
MEALMDDNSLEGRGRYSGVVDVLARMVLEYERTGTTRGHRRHVSDNAIAKMIGISSASWNAYVNGRSLPALDTALLIGEWVRRYLGQEERDRFMELCGHSPNFFKVDDERLISILQNWEYLAEAKDEIYEHSLEVMREYTERERKKLDKSNGPPGQ